MPRSPLQGTRTLIPMCDDVGMRRFGFVYNPTNDLAQEAWDEAAGWCDREGSPKWRL